MRQGSTNLHSSDDLKLRVGLGELLRLLEGLDLLKKACLEKNLLSRDLLRGSQEMVL